MTERGPRLRILALADIHGGTRQLTEVLAHPEARSADLIAVAGDIVRFLNPAGFAGVAALLRETGIAVVAVAGNCDGPRVESLLTQEGWNISGRGCLLPGAPGAGNEAAIGLAGAAGAPPYVTYSWHTIDSEIGLLAGAGLREIALAGTRILLTHTQPSGVIAETPSGRAELPGSPALRQAMDTYQPHLLICGHIHEGRSITEVGATTVVCCGSVRDKCFAVIEAPCPGRPLATLHQL